MAKLINFLPISDKSNFIFIKNRKNGKKVLEIHLSNLGAIAEYEGTCF